MRTLLGMAVVLALACGTVAADDKIDPKKLVGKWEQVKPEKPKIVVEYTADGKLKGAITIEDKEITVEGTYKLDGNKLTMTSKIMGEKEQTRTVTITKLTDEELEGETDTGMKSSFKRIKK